MVGTVIAAAMALLIGSTNWIFPILMTGVGAGALISWLAEQERGLDAGG